MENQQHHQTENTPQSQDGQHHQTRHQDNEIGLIFGRKGSGKTTLARSLLPKTKRALVLDTLGRDYGGGCVVTTAGGLRDYWQRVKEFTDFCIICRPRDDEMVREFFHTVRHAVNVTAMVEEADRYCSPYNIQEDLGWSINYGRQFGQTLIGCARRAAAVSRTWTANADWIVAHQTQEPNDLAYLAEYGFIAENLKTLPPFEWEMVGESRLRF